ncbi:uncharacterized protein LOC116115478 [Pistacia vera]|uniref:uncharacterized protein LOC116115478 n=1 Tax=Pistacia vera TaxID=55513 RepID=UPI001263B189|nr:uncharacterized protein LOC116115478 [Pistacia vera]
MVEILFLSIVFVQIAVLEERKKVVEEKDEDEMKESETNVFTHWSSSKSNELTVDEALKKETQDSNISHLDLDLCLKGHGDDHDSTGQGKEVQLMKQAFSDLF